MRPLLLLALLLPGAARAQLNGDYTIGGGSPDYATISDAVADLLALGTSGPVDFKIRAGTYDDQVTITQFARSGAPDDPVTFIRASNSITVTWRFALAGSLNNWIVKLDGADYVTFQGITFEAVSPFGVNGRLLVFEDGADHNTVRNCTLEGLLGAADDRATLVYGIGTNNDFNAFRGSTFSLGYRGIDLEGAGASDRSEGTVITGGDFGGQMVGGIRLRFHEEAVVDENTVTDAAWSNGSAYAAIFADGGATEITRNTVDMQGGAIGIQLQSAGAVVQRLIANNFVNARSNANADAGIVLTTGSVDVVHNTVRVASTAADAAALRVNTGTIPDVHLQNNLFVNDGGGYALEVPGVGDVESSDYNNLYTTGAVLVEWEGADLNDLGDYQDASGLDANSVSVAVAFVDIAGTGDLHLDSFSDDDTALIGDPFAGITEDADGDARDPFNPKMGADEGIPLPPLDDADDPGPCYTIGGGGADYVALLFAIDDLNRLGTKGPVTFCIRPGSQSSGQTIEDFDRATDDPVTFRADDPNNPPTLAFSGGAILTVDGADHLAFENLILGPPAPLAGENRVLELKNDVEHLTVTGCTLQGIPGASTDAGSLVWGRRRDQFLTFTDNLFLDGYRALDLEGVSPTDRSDGNVIEGNRMENQARHGVRMINQDGAVVHDNVVETGASNTSDYAGISVDGRGAEVTANRVRVFDGGRGIVIGESADPSGRRRVANNAVTLTGSAADAGIHLGGNDFVDVHHNTVHVTGTFGLTTATALRVEGGAVGLNVRNNLLINTGDGPAYVIDDASSLTRSDYNDLYTEGATLAEWDGTAYSTLAELRAAAAPDELHTVSVPVTFVDPEQNLHLAGPSVGDDDLAGVPLASVTVDVDGDARSATAPYMGADEAATPLTLSDFVLAATNTTPLTAAVGDGVSFSYAITNNTAADATGDLFFTATPGGVKGVILSGALPAGQTVVGTFTQQVPGNAPPGTYTYSLNIGQFPNLVVDSGAFSATVIAALLAAGEAEDAGRSGWVVSDAAPWVLEGEVLALGAAAEPEPVAVEAASAARPAAFALHEAYPNPSAGRATLRFDLPEGAAVRIAVYDLLGREVALLADGEVEAGTHAATLDGQALPSGVYLVRLTAGAFAAVRRVTLIR